MFLLIFCSFFPKVQYGGSCNGMCASFRECALCTVFGTGYYDKETCEKCTVEIVPVDAISDRGDEFILLLKSSK